MNKFNQTDSQRCNFDTTATIQATVMPAHHGFVEVQILTGAVKQQYAEVLLTRDQAKTFARQLLSVVQYGDRG